VGPNVGVDPETVTGPIHLPQPTTPATVLPSKCTPEKVVVVWVSVQLVSCPRALNVALAEPGLLPNIDPAVVPPKAKLTRYPGPDNKGATPSDSQVAVTTHASPAAVVSSLCLNRASRIGAGGK
jgi:hypothetical protein